MSIFEQLTKRDHEEIVFCQDPHTGLKAIIAIHNTVLGPALGGCRMYPYKDEEAAITDVLRLSRGMTNKSSVAGLNLGGGKSVIIGDPKTMKTEGLFRSFGRFVESLNGKYITAEDVGTTVRDMAWVRMETSFVTGIPESLGGSGDPSPVTAYGVYMGMKAAAKEAFGNDSLTGLTVAVQGVGSVGRHLVKHLHKENAKIYIADVDQDRVRQVLKEYPVEVIDPDLILETSCDILAPCAMGGVLNEASIAKLRCKVIAGGANNQLEKESVNGPQIHARKILYSPDFAINAGGVINVANELEGYNRERALHKAEFIYDTMSTIFRMAKEQKILPHEAAYTLAEQRINTVGRLRQTNTGWVKHEDKFKRKRF